jgi:hypothetical protein
MARARAHERGLVPEGYHPDGKWPEDAAAATRAESLSGVFFPLRRDPVVQPSCGRRNRPRPSNPAAFSSSGAGRSSGPAHRWPTAPPHRWCSTVAHHRSSAADRTPITGVIAAAYHPDSPPPKSVPPPPLGDAVVPLSPDAAAPPPRAARSTATLCPHHRHRPAVEPAQP